MLLEKKKEDTLELPSAVTNIEKGLVYTKDSYLSILTDTFEQFQSRQYRKNEKVDLWGIYYTAFIGLLRSGILCTRERGKTGFPVITITVGDRKYFADESALVGLLGQEAEFLIHPYEDTSASYVGSIDYRFDIATGNNEMPDQTPNDKTLRKELENLRKELESEKKAKEKAEEKVVKIKESAKKKEAELYALCEQKSQEAKKAIEEANRKVETIREQIAEAEQPHEDLRKELKKIKEEGENALEKAKKEHASEILRLKKDLEKEHSHVLTLRSEKEEMEEQTKKYTYDPNYDHYYSDVLPKLVDQIEFNQTDLLIRGLCMLLSGIAIVLSFVLFL